MKNPKIPDANGILSVAQKWHNPIFAGEPSNRPLKLMFDGFTCKYHLLFTMYTNLCRVLTYSSLAHLLMA